jgi:hypothetical protein
MAAVGAVAGEAAQPAAPAAPAARAPLPETKIARTPTVLQLESVECGAAALSMVLAHHGRWVPLEQMRVDCGVSRDGSKAGGLLRAARMHGMVARGFKKEPNAIAQLPLPCIVFWNFNHFVVLEGFRDGRALLNDPARGRRAVDAAEFDQAFTGVVLTFEPGPEFTRGGHPPSVMRSLRQYLDGFRLSIGVVLLIGLALVIPGLVMPWLLGRFVDEVLVAHMDGVAGPLLTGLIVAAIARAVLVGVQARVLMDTFGRAVRASSRRFFSHALRLPMTVLLAAFGRGDRGPRGSQRTCRGDHLRRPRAPRTGLPHRELLPGPDGAARATPRGRGRRLPGARALRVARPRAAHRRGVAGALGAGRASSPAWRPAASRTSRA